MYLQVYNTLYMHSFSYGNVLFKELPYTYSFIGYITETIS